MPGGFEQVVWCGRGLDLGERLATHGAVGWVLAVAAVEWARGRPRPAAKFDSLDDHTDFIKMFVDNPDIAQLLGEAVFDALYGLP